MRRNRTYMFYAITALLLWQAVPDEPLGLYKHVASLGLAGIIFFFYRQDRKDSEKRYADLAVNHTQIVQQNTAALTKLTTLIENR